MSRLYMGTNTQNLKSATLTVLEQLAITSAAHTRIQRHIDWIKTLSPQFNNQLAQAMEQQTVIMSELKLSVD